MKVEIKRAKIGSLKDIQKLTHKLLKNDQKEFDPTLNCKWPFSEQGKKFLKNIINKKSCCTFIALINGKIVGYLTGFIEKEGSYRKLGRLVALGNIFILEQYRNLGIGTKLCQAFFDWCKKNKIKMIRTEVYTKNKKAIDFYRNNGFSDYTLRMEKKLLS